MNCKVEQEMLGGRAESGVCVREKGKEEVEDGRGGEGGETVESLSSKMDTTTGNAGRWTLAAGRRTPHRKDLLLGTRYKTNRGEMGTVKYLPALG